MFTNKCVFSENLKRISPSKSFLVKEDKHLQKGSLLTEYLVKTMSFFLDPIFKWQWKHYFMFGVFGVKNL